MIKFFRNIRQNLLNEGKTTKYFKYAIGEIILVVVGILIAENLAPVHSSRCASSSDARKGGFSKDIIYNASADIPLGIEGERKGKIINQ